jgi:hypothetical protein
MCIRIQILDRWMHKYVHHLIGIWMHAIMIDALAFWLRFVQGLEKEVYRIHQYVDETLELEKEVMNPYLAHVRICVTLCT